MQDSAELFYEKRVSDGVRFLDSKVPDWFKSIDLNQLDMLNPCHCVMGQLFPSYRMGLERLGVDVTINEDVALGFDRSFGLDLPHNVDELTPIWKREIGARLAATTS